MPTVPPPYTSEILFSWNEVARVRADSMCMGSLPGEDAQLGLS